MAATSHQLAIAKASLSAGLLRAAPAPVSRDDITEFHNLLDQTLTICSPENIQNCKRWILKNMNSPARITSFAKYISALSPVLSDSISPRARSSARRKRLHLLYLINDILHHRKYHETDNSAFAENVKEILSGLFTTAVYPKAVKQLAKLEHLLSIWEMKQYYTQPFLEDLRTMIREIAAEKSPASEDTVDPASQNKQKALLLPPFHGDPSIPFYDLPAGNFLPHIVPNSTVPINPRVVKPVQFSSVTPSGTLATAVQDFLTAVDTMFDGKAIAEDPDAVGGFGGMEGEGYYGWSKEFCEQMKHKKKAAIDKERLGRAKDSDRGRERRKYSYSSSSYSSRSRSRSPSNSRHGGRRRSRSSSYNRSRSRDNVKHRGDSRSRSPSPSQSDSRPSSKFQHFQSSLQTPSTLVPGTMPGGQQFLPHPPPPPPMSYGFQQQQQQQQQFASGWQPPPPPLPNAAGFPPPHILQGFQQFGQFPMGPMQMGFGAMNGQWSQQQQQQQQGLQQQQGAYNQGSFGYGAGSQGSGEAPGNGEEDYRSVKGRQMSAKRGWNT
ncbi:hypothetical protein EDC01DRAFT_667589 [Geopyxis carbonaria]|nr:hypothetical protein EDC01DRAFT_667589 [Geopyxis carbonaria]